MLKTVNSLRVLLIWLGAVAFACCSASEAKQEEFYFSEEQDMEASREAGRPVWKKVTDVPGYPDPNKLTIPRIWHSNLPREMKTEYEIALLKAESLEKSLKGLANYNFEITPGAIRWMGEGRIFLKIPLDPSTGRGRFGPVWMTRRVLKVRQELATLPKEEASDIVNKEIEKALGEYQKRFDAHMRPCLIDPNEEKSKRYNLDNIKVKFRKGIGTGYTIHDPTNKKAQPSLRTVRWKILALVSISGQLELAGTKEAIMDVYDYAVWQREIFYDKSSSFSELSIISFLDSMSLYNRQILAAAWLGVNSDAIEEKTELLEALPYTLEKAYASEYDMLGMPMDFYNVNPVDESRLFAVKYFDQMDDEWLERIFSAFDAK